MSEQNLIPESEVKIYRKLQQHLHTLPVGYPATKSGVELRLLKRVFSPEEAKIALKLKWIRQVISMNYDPQLYSDAFLPLFLKSRDTQKLVDNRSLTCNRHNLRHNLQNSFFYGL